MSVKINGKYLGNKNTELTHGPSSATLRTAAPLDNNGDGSSFSPTDMIAAAAGSCMLTIMDIYAERNSIDLTGTHFSVEKEMQTSPRRIGKITIEFHLPSGLDAEQRKKLENAALTCPVHKSLHPEVELPTEFLYDL